LVSESLESLLVLGELGLVRIEQTRYLGGKRARLAGRAATENQKPRQQVRAYLATLADW
jgi:hypothetical protein